MVVEAKECVQKTQKGSTVGVAVVSTVKKFAGSPCAVTNLCIYLFLLLRLC